MDEERVEQYRNLLNKEWIPEDAGEYADGLTKIIRRIPDGYGRWIGCGPGWYPLIIELDEKIAEIAPNYVVAQVKEKFGTLRYYFSVYGDETAKYDEVDSIIDEYEARSGTICELCGADGEMKVRRYWYQTLCSECAEKNGYEDIPAKKGENSER